MSKKNDEMSKHPHVWEPVAHMPSGYRCSCGATARRNTKTGILWVHKRPHKWPDPAPEQFTGLEKTRKERQNAIPVLCDEEI